MGNTGGACTSVSGQVPGFSLIPEGLANTCVVDQECISDWGNGICDDRLNNAGCGWDGGDCCLSTCLVSDDPETGIPKPCYGADAETCKDPSAVENNGLNIRVEMNQVWVQGADPGANVMIFASSENPQKSILTDDHDWCSGTAVGVNTEGEFHFATGVMDDEGTGTISLDTMADAGMSMNLRCKTIFQAVQVQGCKTSNVAFMQRWHPQLWTKDVCESHGHSWCTFGDLRDYNDYFYDFEGELECCMDVGIWCDLPVYCSDDGEFGNGMPNYEKGPDVCASYWLSPETYQKYLDPEEDHYGWFKYLEENFVEGSSSFSKWFKHTYLDNRPNAPSETVEVVDESG